MSERDLEQRLRAAFAEARESTEEQPDLFARVTLSIEEAAARRRWRWRAAAGVAAFVLAVAALAIALAALDRGTDHNDLDSRGFDMPWWVIEVVTDIVLVALAIGLGPFIKRFGRAYAADVFRANPRTGKSYLVLTDVAYYLIFTSFVLFTVTLDAPFSWKYRRAAQLEHEVARVGGILLLMGVLHALNVVALPLIGRLLASGRRSADPPSTPPTAPTPAHLPPTLTPGTWTVRVERVEDDGGPPA